MSDNWDDLRVFLAVARHESLSAAARKLGIDPATVGRRIARFEEHMGQALFIKSPNGYVVADAAQKLVDHASSMEGIWDKIDTDITRDATTLSGQIRIGAPDGLANFVLPQVCAQISVQNPELELQIVALPRVVNLTKREADLAITVSPPQTGRLTVKKITDYHLHLAASERYFLRHGKPTSLSDLKKHPITGYINDMIFDKELDYLANLKLPKITFASNSVVVQYNWLRAACGIGVVHDFALAHDPNLTRILMDEFSLKRSFYLIRHAEDRRHGRLDKFTQIFATKIKEEVERLEQIS